MLEQNKIHLGDCLELMKEIDEKSISMILCDLPYGTSACAWDIIIPFKPLWEQYERIIKDNGSIILFGSQPFTTDLINSNRKLFKYCLVWDKDKCGNFALAKKRPMITHEDICVFYKKQPTYNPQMVESGSTRNRKGKVYEQANSSVNIASGVNKVSETHNEGLRYPKSILHYKKNWRPQDTLHNTQKPEELYEWIIKSYSNEGDLILDNCCGSGTIGVAKAIGRNFIGIEKSQEYYDIAVNRVNGFIYI